MTKRKMYYVSFTVLGVERFISAGGRSTSTECAHLFPSKARAYMAVEEYLNRANTGRPLPYVLHEAETVKSTSLTVEPARRARVIGEY